MARDPTSRRRVAPGLVGTEEPVDVVTALRQAVHPPLRDRRFWAVQAMVVLVAGLHLFVDLHASIESRAFPDGTPVALLVIPVGYAAFRFGLSGSAATALWATLLWLPDLTLPQDLGHSASDVVNLALVDLVALFVGHRVERQRLAHARAEQATLDRLAAETRYARVLVEAEEDQRRRLARELHDEPLQLFLLLARRLQGLADTPEVPAATAAQLHEAGRQALDAAGRLRALARSLRPPALDQLGLIAAIESLLADAEEEHGVTTELQVGATLRPLPADVELGSFRIVQESVRNTCRHAAAGRVLVTLDMGPDELAITVADDGRGFLLDGLDHLDRSHLGVLGMRERARLLGGTLEVRSAPGEGTTVRAGMPLAPGPLRSLPGAAPAPRPATAIPVHFPCR